MGVPLLYPLYLGVFFASCHVGSLRIGLKSLGLKLYHIHFHHKKKTWSMWFHVCRYLGLLVCPSKQMAQSDL